MHFRGNDYVALPWILTSPSDVTFVTVAKANYIQTGKCLGILEYSNSNLQGFRYRFNSDGHMWLLVANDSTYKLYETSNTYSAKEIVFSGFVIKNGVSVDMFLNSVFTKYSLPIQYTIGSFMRRYLGVSFYPIGDWLNGDIYLAALYDEAKSEEWIKAFYQDWQYGNDLHKYIDNTCRLWLDGYGIDMGHNIWHDYSPYHNDGTIYGAVEVSNTGVIT